MGVGPVGAPRSFCEAPGHARRRRDRRASTSTCRAHLRPTFVISTTRRTGRGSARARGSGIVLIDCRRARVAESGCRRLALALDVHWVKSPQAGTNGRLDVERTSRRRQYTSVVPSGAPAGCRSPATRKAPRLAHVGIEKRLAEPRKALSRRALERLATSGRGGASGPSRALRRSRTDAAELRRIFLVCA